MKISDLVGKNVAVNCDSKEKIDILIKTLEERGYKYDHDGIRPDECHTKSMIETLSEYGIRIYVDLTNGYIDCAFPKFYHEAGYKIIKFEELEFEEV